MPSAENIYYRGIKYYLERNYHLAEKFFQAVILLYPESIEALKSRMGLFMVYFKTWQMRSALRNLIEFLGLVHSDPIKYLDKIKQRRQSN